LSSEAATPATIPHPRDLAFTFPSDKAGASGGSSDGQPSTPPSGYNPGRRRASMHDAIDLNKIDTRLYDKKLVRQASVTSIEEESQGTVHVSLEHNPETSILTVNLVRAHNLLPRDIIGTANPYCRLTLLPGHRTSAQSRIHRKTLNPEFEEEFIFELSAEEVDDTTLELSFYEYDQFSKDECVGFVRIPLAGMDLRKQVDLWRSISPYEKPKDQRDLGDVMFSLSYLPSAERLTVVVVKARNLQLQTDAKGDLNSFIKVCLTSGSKKIKKKKTSTSHGTNSPTWNEALVFSVHRENLKNIGLEVLAYHDNKIGVDECIGRVRLLPDCDDGVNCQELLKEKSTPARWYSLS
ncbi:synaptotagmin-1-like, partial [Physella acuta]|uniref:synaptotagmin-1-like n=1 Tax=Physella acuta TaxID=109671 RepID=UPI0027DAC90E